MRKIIIIALLLFSYIKANNYCSNNKSPKDEDSCFALSGPNLHDDMCCYYELVYSS